MTTEKQIALSQPSEPVSLEVMINGEKYRFELPPTYRLVDILRKTLGLTGTKISCEVGRCGSCSVLMNGKLVNSCLLMAYQIQNAEIETIESLSKDKLDPIQEVFLQEGALQCGYCTPGMVMALKALLIENPNPTKEEAIDSLSGNLCRCTGYSPIVRVIDRLVKV